MSTVNIDGIEVKNSYPELPIIPFAITTIDMNNVIHYLQSKTILVEIKRAVYCIFRNEGGNGKNGICWNFGGIQSDSGRWQPDTLAKYFTATTYHKENLKKTMRGFLCFGSYESFLDFLIEKITERGLYIGGKINYETDHTTITNIDDWCNQYEKVWVEGDVNVVADSDEKESFESMYNQAKNLFV